MNKNKYTIEFTLLGKRLKVTIEASSKADAEEELFKAIRAKTVIHSVTDNFKEEIGDLFGKIFGGKVKFE